MPELTCHCGAVRARLDEPPATVTQCNCSICRRYGALWAYFSPANVRFASAPSATVSYRWGDGSIGFHHCRTCGCVTHWSPVDPASDRMAVNARLLAPEVLAAARVRRFDGAETWRYLGE